MLRPRHLAMPIVLIFLLTAMGLAQNKEKIKYLTPTYKGSTGLFNLFVADTLRQGEWSIAADSLKFNREPGDLDFSIFPLSVTLGLTDRIELFTSFEAYKRVHADDIQVHKILLPSSPLVPARLRPAVPGQPGILAWYNDTPFMDVGFGDGTGDLWAGVKVNLLSERRGDPFALAFQPIARFHLTNDRKHLSRGLTSGVTDAGFDGIVSKNLKGGGTLTANAGLLFADDLLGVNRQHRFNYGTGFDAPLGSLKIHLIGEVVGSTFFGSRGPGIANPKSPVDLYGGIRLNPTKWLSVSGAYNYNLQHIDSALYGGVDKTGCQGWFAQAAFQRKVNRPPMAECTVDRTTIIEGEQATVKVSVTDEDDDTLTVNWRTSGGKLTQQENSAVFDSTGLAPGKYTVTAEVSDGTTTANCTSDINVEKHKLAPTITCQPGATVTEGESATLRATASDPDNDPLTYTWTVDGQPVTNNQAEFVFGTTGRTIGTHAIRVTVTDVDNMTASCDFTVTVNRRSNNNPTVSLTLDKSDVYAGEVVTATAQASDPDNDPLTYSWTVDGQQRPETGTQIQINTNGMTGGNHTVSVTVRDDRGGSATDTKSFTVREKVIIPIRGLKPNNVAKARLDEIALKLQQDPRLKATITGYTDDRGTDARAEKAAQQRADAVRDYLVKQHKIDAARIETKSGGKTNPIADNTTEAGREQNRRVEIELYVP